MVGPTITKKVKELIISELNLKATKYKLRILLSKRAFTQ